MRKINRERLIDRRKYRTTEQQNDRTTERQKQKDRTTERQKQKDRKADEHIKRTTERQKYFIKKERERMMGNVKTFLLNFGVKNLELNFT